MISTSLAIIFNISYEKPLCQIITNIYSKKRRAVMARLEFARDLIRFGNYDSRT